jgi:histidinol dehydrogenase
MPENNQRPLSEQLKEVGANIEQELKRAIQIIDEQVVPEVREKGATALRDVSQRLSKLAEHLESLKPKPPV